MVTGRPFLQKMPNQLEVLVGADSTRFRRLGSKRRHMREAGKNLSIKRCAVWQEDSLVAEEPQIA